MEKFVLDVVAVFAGVFVALAAVAGVAFVWIRRRFRSLRARLVMGATGGELSLAGMVGSFRVNRHSVSTAIIRRRLRLDVDAAVAAVHAAERAGAAIGELGSLAAELQVASDSLDAAMASMGSSGVTPVILARANDLSSSARRLRREAEQLLASSAVPGLFAPQPVEDRRFMDGGVCGSGTHLDLLAGAERALVLSLSDGSVEEGRMTCAPGSVRAEFDALRASGCELFVAAPASVSPEDLMDPHKVPEALELGRRQAWGDLGAIRQLWS